MDILNNLYIVSVKNKHFLAHAAMLVIGMIIGKEEREPRPENRYFGDNLPFTITERMKDS